MTAEQKLLAPAAFVRIANYFSLKGVRFHCRIAQLRLDAQLLQRPLQCMCRLRRARDLISKHKRQLLVQLMQLLVEFLIHLQSSNARPHYLNTHPSQPHFLHLLLKPLSSEHTLCTSTPAAQGGGGDLYTVKVAMVLPECTLRGCVGKLTAVKGPGSVPHGSHNSALRNAHCYKTPAFTVWTYAFKAKQASTVIYMQETSKPLSHTTSLYRVAKEASRQSHTMRGNRVAKEASQDKQANLTAQGITEESKRGQCKRQASHLLS
eukprot:1094473-Pelagomonas_calceolata.AAC.5